MTDALAVQHGGTHYKTMLIQPIEFATANRYDPAAFSVLKYICRHARKDGRLDLDKAGHFVQLRLTMLNLTHTLQAAADNIPIERFISTNQIGGAEAAILYDLHEWAARRSEENDSTEANLLFGSIQKLSDKRYPKEPT